MKSCKSISATIGVALGDAVSWYCAILIVALMLSGSFRDDPDNIYMTNELQRRGTRILHRPCDEIYVVGDGETLHTISDKCGDPFIVEKNPHIHDPDDVFPGLVIKITPSLST